MTQKFKNSKTDILEQFIRVRYAVSMNFIDVLKKAYMLRAKNAKPQYTDIYLLITGMMLRTERIYGRTITT